MRGNIAKVLTNHATDTRQSKIHATGRVLLAALLWATGFLGFASNTLQASILLPDQSPLDIESLLADTGSQPSAGASGASSSSRNSTPELPAQDDRNDRDQPIVAIFSPTQTSTGGTTSGTSSSTSGSGGGSTFPIDSVAAVSFSDEELVTWACNEQRFSLPMPPGNDLLRPPQCLL